MPYKVTGIKEVNQNYKKLMKKISEDDTAKNLVKIAITGAGFSKLLTPREYGPLINSQYVLPPKKTSSGMSIEIGYVQNYAAFLNNNTNWKPRPVSEKGKGKAAPQQTKQGSILSNSGGKSGPSSNMRAEPMFLQKGFTGKNLAKIKALIVNGYKVK